MDNEKTDGDRADLNSLAERIQRSREAAGLSKKAETDQVPANRAAGEGLRVAIEFVVAVFVGAGLGFTIGRYAGNQSLGLVIGMFVGFAAGLRGIHRQLMVNVATMETSPGMTKEEEDADADGRDDQ